MPWKSTGPYVTIVTSGTPVRVTSNRSDPAARLVCYALFIQQLEANQGKLWLMGVDRDIPYASMNKSTGIGVVAIIPAPSLLGTLALELPSVLYRVSLSPGGGNAADFYLDADVSGDKALVSIITI